MSASATPQYITKGEVLVGFATLDNDVQQFWRLERPVVATVSGRYFTTAAGTTQDRGCWDGMLTLLRVKLSEIEGPNGAMPAIVEFEHEHKDYYGFFAGQWTETPDGVSVRVHHTSRDFPLDTAFKFA